jgi:hypothetical protein
MRLSLAEISLLLFLFYCHASSGFENAHKTRLCWVVFNHIPVKLVGHVGVVADGIPLSQWNVVKMPVISFIGQPLNAECGFHKLHQRRFNQLAVIRLVVAQVVVNVIPAGVDKWFVDVWHNLFPFGFVCLKDASIIHPGAERSRVFSSFFPFKIKHLGKKRQSGT